MGVNLKDAVKFNPNSAWFLDALVNANFGDYSGYSSIGDITGAGTTFSTSTRLGYR